MKSTLRLKFAIACHRLLQRKILPLKGQVMGDFGACFACPSPIVVTHAQLRRPTVLFGHKNTNLILGNTLSHIITITHTRVLRDRKETERRQKGERHEERIATIIDCLRSLELFIFECAWVRFSLSCPLKREIIAAKMLPRTKLACSFTFSIYPRIYSTPEKSAAA